MRPPAPSLPTGSCNMANPASWYNDYRKLRMLTRTRASSNAGFSLVELSIVLVILGLLVGGVLSGQSLIRAAELRAVSTEYARYVTAVQSFRDKYFAIPGDMNNATAFWGFTGGTGCTNSSGTAVTTPGTCDGNGGGIIDNAAAASQTGEVTQFWRQLALAGLIEGTYTGVVGGGSANHCVIGTNCPRSKLSNSGWGAFHQGNYGGDINTYALDYGNVLVFGAQSTNYLPVGATLKPEEAWNIDTKLDDGKPATGKAIAVYWNNACATSTANNDYAGNYKLTDNTARCVFYFRQVF